MKKSILFLWLSLTLTARAQPTANSLTATATARPDYVSPYRLRTSLEISLLGAGGLTYGAAYAFNRSLQPLTPASVAQLNPAAVSGFDRSALSRYSPNANRLSDLTLGAGVGLAGVVMLTARPTDALRKPLLKSELMTIGVMYAETMLLTNGLKSAVKNAVERTRPYAYNPAAPLEDKLDKDTQRSFYSGHAANAFATAVFAAEVYYHYHPRSRGKAWVWTGSLGLATGTAYLRYQAGQHFPSDLLVGAAVGSLAGWGIPKLHQNRAGKPRAFWRNATLSPWSNGLASGVYLRWNVSGQSIVN